MLGYLSLVPGVVILHGALGVDSAGLVAGITAFSFAALLLTLAAAWAHDRFEAHLNRRPASSGLSRAAHAPGAML